MLIYRECETESMMCPSVSDAHQPESLKRASNQITVYLSATSANAL
jgi:hypothetical protein